MGVDKAVTDLREAGNAHMAKGAWAKAIHCYNLAIELDVKNALLYSNRAAARFFLKQYNESLEDAEKVLELNPTWWKGYKRKGLSLVHLYRYEEAIDVFEKSLKLEPDNEELQKGLQFAKDRLEQAQNLHTLPPPAMMQKLDGIPVFILTDNKGQPFFITYEDGQQVCTFYFQYSDALSTLDWIKKEVPDLGKTASVLAISLSQAFQLAQDSQQPLPEETEKKEGETNGNGNAEASAAETKESSEKAAEKPAAATEKSEEKTADETAGDDKVAADGEPAEKAKDEKPSDDLDADLPLAFQFRPELRQVEIAVQLLNNPELKKVVKVVEEEKREDSGTKEDAEVAKLEGEHAKEKAEKVNAEEKAEEEKAEEKVEEAKAEVEADGEKPEEKAVEEKAGKKEEDASVAASEETAAADTAKVDSTELAKAEGGEAAEGTAGTETAGEDGEVELTVDNFNGIPIFQARGLTLLQNNKHYIPLFFSKWDLDDAWRQLNKITSAGVPDETEIDVGTLEDVMRRMVEGDAKEFDNVIFVPTRESLKYVGREFPLDDMTNSAFGRKPPKKATFQAARQIAAAGGSQAAIKEAIQNELLQLLDENQYSDLLSRIKKSQAEARASKANSAGTNSSTASSSRPVSKPVTSKMAVKPKKKKSAAPTQQPESPTTSTITTEDPEPQK